MNGTGIQPGYELLTDLIWKWSLSCNGDAAYNLAFLKLVLTDIDLPDGILQEGNVPSQNCENFSGSCE
jgi:hypothetical protein